MNKSNDHIYIGGGGGNSLRRRRTRLERGEFVGGEFARGRNHFHSLLLSVFSLFRAILTLLHVPFKA